MREGDWVLIKGYNGRSTYSNKEIRGQTGQIEAKKSVPYPYYVRIKSGEFEGYSEVFDEGEIELLCDCRSPPMYSDETDEWFCPFHHEIR